MKLALGTVQFGMNYGIANIHGQPCRSESFNIIDYAIKSGIKMLDTAPSYQESERIIGEYINNHLNKESEFMTICSKLNAINPEIVLGKEEALNLIEKEVLQSLKKLNIKTLDYLLLHWPKNLTSHNGYIREALVTMREVGLVSKIGASVYTPEEVQQLIDLNCFDVIQVPMNILDTKLETLGLLDELHRNNIEIHVRSVFLQGLLFMDPSSLPSNLNMAKEPLLRLNELANEIGLKPAYLSLIYLRDIKEVNKILVGCESIEQLKNNIKAMQYPPLSSYYISKIKELFNDVPEQVLNPSLWGER